MERPLRVIMDPRAKATQQALEQQYTLGASVYAQLRATHKARAELESVASQLKKLEEAGDETAALKEAIHNARAKLDVIRSGKPRGEDTDGSDEAGLAGAASGLGTDLRVVESGDRTAPAQAVEIFAQMKKASQEGIDAWQHFKTVDLAALNAALADAHREPVHIAAIEEQVHYAMTR